MKKLMKIIRLIVLFCASVVLVISCVKLALIFMEYRAGEKEYETLTAYVKTEPESASEQDTAETDDFRMPKIDFAGLRDINEDLVCWLSFPALDIGYPVVQGKDNDEYLYRTFEGGSNSSGCIFMDADNSADFTDRHTILYGHNMKNGAMFGSLSSLMGEEDILAEEPYFYVYTEKEAVRCRVIAFYATQDGGAAWSRIGNDEEYDAFLNGALRSSAYAGYEKSLTEGRPEVVTLSTCHGKAGSTGRFVVHGVVEQRRVRGGEG